MFTMKVTGFVELERALRALPDELTEKVLNTALRKAGEPMAAAAKEHAPRSDDPGPHGHMADSIKLRAIRGATDLFDTEVKLWLGPDPDHFYGSFNEFGTVHQAAKPFMRPAFDQYVDETLTVFGKELGQAIEKAAKKVAG